MKITQSFFTMAVLLVAASFTQSVLAQNACAGKPKDFLSMTSKQCPDCYEYMTKVYVESNTQTLVPWIMSHYPTGPRKLDVSDAERKEQQRLLDLWRKGHWLIEGGTMTLGGADFQWAVSTDKQYLNSNTSLCTLKTKKRVGPPKACYKGYVYNTEKERCMTPDGKCEEGWKLDATGTCVK